MEDFNMSSKRLAQNKYRRSKDKNSAMNAHNRKVGAQRKNGNAGHTSSSSAQADAVRGVIDVADSSDEQRYRGGGGWAVPKQHGNRDLLIDERELEDDLNEVENAQMSAGDFDLMSQLPNATGGHFKFASEKHWESAENDDELLQQTAASEYFTLNLKLLNAGLQTIPYHKRMDYASSMFTREQIKTMEKSAELAEQNYQSVLREHETNSAGNAKRSSSAKSAKTQVKANTNVSQGANNAPPDELDELLSLTTTQIANVDLFANNEQAIDAENIPPTDSKDESKDAASNKDDIQEWLDNVLEE